MASSSTCVASLIATGQWQKFEQKVSPNSVPGEELEALLRNIIKRAPGKTKSAGLDAGNPFSVGFALEAVKVAYDELERLAPTQAAKLAKRVEPWAADATELLLRSLSIDRRNLKLSAKDPKKPDADKWAQRGSAHIAEFLPTTFLTQLVLRALIRKTSIKGIKPVEQLVLNEVAEWSWGQLLEELALLGSSERAADPLALAYALILFVTCKPSSKRSADDALIVTRSVDAFFAAQLKTDGGWPQSKPLHFYPGVGNAYCYDYEVLTQLLECVELRSSLLLHMDKIERAFCRAEESAIDIAQGGKSWSSEHHPHLPDAESWSTASVYHFVHSADRLLAECIRQDVFTYLRAPYRPPSAKPMSHADGERLFKERFLDCNITGKNGRQESLTRVLLKRLLAKIAEEAPSVALGAAMSKDTPVAGILFGPPGTSKSQLASIIASYLNWPLLSIDPSQLVKRGLDQVQSESNVVFRMIAALEQTVVFLDEFDELVRDRTDQAADITSRFLTTAMLPKLTSISESRRIIFLLATNYVSKFDFAIRRPGRFDFVLQIMPPKWPAKQKFAAWKQACARIARDIKLTDTAKRKRTWASALGDFTYLEFDTLCKAIHELSRQTKVKELVERQWGACTLSQKVHSDGKEITLYDSCLEDAKLIRIP